MRVDNVPLWLKPAFHLYGYGLGALFHASNKAIRNTCRVTYRHRASEQGARIECIWHEHLPAYMALYLPAPEGVRYAWMNHPIWYMRPIHVLLAWNGVKELALGSSGHDGKRALARVIAWLRQGYRTSMAVDGPAGPTRVLKRGALDMALESGRPIVAIRFSYEHAWRAPDWDRKHFPHWGSHVIVEESEPIYVTRDNYEACRARVTECLG